MRIQLNGETRTKDEQLREYEKERYLSGIRLQKRGLRGGGRLTFSQYLTKNGHEFYLLV